MSDDLNNVYKFVERDGAVIEEDSRGLSLTEVLSKFGYEYDQLNDEEKNFVSLHYHKGRAIGLATAVDFLFKSMRDKNGGQVALSYLVRFAEKWESDTVDGELKGVKAMRVIFDN